MAEPQELICQVTGRPGSGKPTLADAVAGLIEGRKSVPSVPAARAELRQLARARGTARAA